MFFLYVEEVFYFNSSYAYVSYIRKAEIWIASLLNASRKNAAGCRIDFAIYSFWSIDNDSFQRAMNRTRRGRVTFRNSPRRVVRIRGAIKLAAANNCASAYEIFILRMANVLGLHPRYRVSTLPPSSQNKSPSQEVRAHREMRSNALLNVCLFYILDLAIKKLGTPLFLTDTRILIALVIFRITRYISRTIYKYSLCLDLWLDNII